MNNGLLLLTSMAANLFGGIIKKRINDRYENNMFSYQFYNAIISIVAAISLLILSDNLSISLYTVIMAVLFGIVTLLQQIFNLYALENGPFSYTTVIISLSTLIPTVSGALFWNEKIKLIQYIGIALMVLCFFLSVDIKDKNKTTGIKWLLFSSLAFLATGLIGIMQKIHQTSSHSDELDAFLIIAFCFSFILSLALSFIFRNKREVITEKDTSKSVLQLLPIVFMILSGIFVALNNKFNLYLSGVLDAAVFFPLVNGGGLVLTTVASVIIFREKLSVLQWTGVFIGIVSVIFVCNPFL